VARRVSLKGKGADLFFGDHPPGVDPDAPELPANDAPAEALDSGPVSQADLDAGSPDESMASIASAALPAPAELEDDGADITADPVGEDDTAAEGLPLIETRDADFFATMWERLDSQASISNSFRYTAPELEELADALYRVTKDAQVRLTKQDLARLGLNVILWDYRRRGDDSWLSAFARRKRRPREE